MTTEYEARVLYETWRSQCELAGSPAIPCWENLERGSQRGFQIAVDVIITRHPPKNDFGLTVGDYDKAVNELFKTREKLDRITKRMSYAEDQISKRQNIDLPAIQRGLAAEKELREENEKLKRRIAFLEEISHTTPRAARTNVRGEFHSVTFRASSTPDDIFGRRLEWGEPEKLQCETKQQAEIVEAVLNESYNQENVK